MQNPIRLPLGPNDANPPSVDFLSLVREDFETHGRDWFSEGFWTLFWHRFGNWRMGVKWKPLRMFLTAIYKVAYRTSRLITGIDLPYTVIVGRRVRLDHFGGMILVAKAIGDETIVRQNTTFGIAKVSETWARPVIGRGVDIGAGAVILGGIHVGDNVTIGANAVVLEDIPEGATAVGIPARIIH